MLNARKEYYSGIGLAILATIIWSGNFIIAKTASQQIAPIGLAFYRWLIATLLLAPFVLKKFNAEKRIALTHWKYFFWVSLSGVTLFNTLVYIAGHHTSAINMALIGTTSSPIFAIIMAVLFLKEQLDGRRITGVLLCICGILLLLSQGSIQRLLSFRFSTGDLWMLAAGFFFAVYSVLVRKKPQGISSLNFLFTIFLLGTLLLFPFYCVEQAYTRPTHWDISLAGSILYLGAGASLLAFLCWNIALQKLGAGRTVLFGNLIPVFSTLEAVALLHETITGIHLFSGLLVVAGLIVSNSRKHQ